MSFEEKKAEKIELVGQTVLTGRYRLDEKLGEGALGAVYKGMQLSTGRTVAVKFLKKDDVSPNDRLRFEQEATCLSLLSHPNLVSIIDFGYDDAGTQYLVLDYIEGETLQSRLAKKGKLTAVEFIDVFTQICKGLSHAHAKGIVHRDLKPSNIMIVADPSGEQIVKIVDFGIARESQSTTRLTSTGGIVGSPAYMSPEQAEGFPCDARSDIYSIGCIMYECLTGRLPFEANTAMAALVKRLHSEPGPFVAGGLEKIVFRALERTPERRYQNASQLLSELSSSDWTKVRARPRTAAGGSNKARLVWLAVALVTVIGLSVEATLVIHPSPPISRSMLQTEVSKDKAEAARLMWNNDFRPAIPVCEHCMRVTENVDYGTYAYCGQRLAFCYKKLGDYSKAAQVYSQIMPSYEKLADNGYRLPNLRQAIYNYGDTLRMLGRQQEADALAAKWKGRTWAE